MKIALILPRAGIYRYKTGAFSRFIRYAPLTLTTLVSLVPEDISTDVHLYDEGIETVEKKNILPDLVGLTAITGASMRAYAYADYFRAQGIPVIMGGVHATLMPHEAKAHADAVITGPAYETWPRALRDSVRGALQPFYHSDPHIDFSKIPNPDRLSLHRSHRKFITVNSIQAVFGCPNSCDFCVTPIVCNGYQHRPIKDVVREVASLRGKYFVFVDPSPIENIAYATDLYRALIPLKKKWTGLATTRLAAHPELMNAMEEAGCKGLLIGFESLSQASVNTIKKAFNRVSDYYHLVKELHRRGIAIMGCFVHGLDSDDKDCFKRTLEFVNNANIDLPRFTVCTPFPGTPFFASLKKDGRILTEDWALYDAQHVVFQPRHMSADELHEGHHRVWREAYRLHSMVKRLACSQNFINAALLTNIAYRRYARKLPLYTQEVMLSDHLI
ncbi:MAG: radical SAM protein [Pseudomonadota bacterium]